MRKNEWSPTSTHPYDFMAYTGFWKYNYICITILDDITMCTEVFKVIRCQYLLHLWTQSQLHSFLSPGFRLSIEFPVCIIQVSYFYKACLYRQTIIAKAQKLFCRKTLLQNNNDARRICSPKRPDRIWDPHGTPSKWYRCSLPETKRPGREASQSPPSSTQLRNCRIYNFTTEEQLRLVYF